MNVSPVTAKYGVRLHRENDAQIASRSTVSGRFTFTRVAHGRAALGAGRHPHLERCLFGSRPLATAVLAGMSDDTAAPSTVVALLGDREETLLRADLAAAATGVTNRRRRTRLRTRAATRPTAGLPGNFNGTLA